jgi:hypothetical protein
VLQWVVVSHSVLQILDMATLCLTDRTATQGSVTSGIMMSQFLMWLLFVCQKDQALEASVSLSCAFSLGLLNVTVCCRVLQCVAGSVHGDGQPGKVSLYRDWT